MRTKKKPDLLVVLALVFGLGVVITGYASQMAEPVSPLTVAEDAPRIR